MECPICGKKETKELWQNLYMFECEQCLEYSIHRDIINLLMTGDLKVNKALASESWTENPHV